jgi:tRNA pseudouridine55 synthase
MKTKIERLPINGILLLNKPYGITSNAALQKVKHLFKAKKAGHTGSLDPMATGMLPICFGEATKFSQYLLNADKCYEATAKLGIKTNTGDALGEIVSVVEHVEVSQAEIEMVIKEFTGSLQQVPSMFSALKHQGVPLYRYARQGIELERKARDITVHMLSLLAFKDDQVEVLVKCSKGTYIRNLMEDIGECLGVGAHLTRLFRLYTAGMEDEVMYSLDELEIMSEAERFSLLLPVDKAVEHLEVINLMPDEVNKLRQGLAIASPQGLASSLLVRIYEEDTHSFIGLGQIQEDYTLRVKRLLAYKPMVCSQEKFI